MIPLCTKDLKWNTKVYLFPMKLHILSLFSIIWPIAENGGIEEKTATEESNRVRFSSNIAQNVANELGLLQRDNARIAIQKRKRERKWNENI